MLGGQPDTAVHRGRPHLGLLAHVGGPRTPSHPNHLNGGPLAAPPGKTWHHRGSVDLGVRSEAGRPAMIRHGFFDLLPQDPPHFTFGRRD